LWALLATAPPALIVRDLNMVRTLTRIGLG